MGSIKKILVDTDLPEREKHHSRMFIDLAENIHIHYREYRFIFSLPEFFEFSEILNKSTIDVRNYLEQNKDYQEGTYPTTIIIAGGKERQLKFLENSPQANTSKYLNNKMTIELQEEYVTDEIHIHYRDFRIGLDRNRFKIIAKNFKIALDNLEIFESKNDYIKKHHNDRIIKNFNSETKEINYFPYVKNIKIDQIQSIKFPNFPENWQGDYSFVNILIKSYKNSQCLPAPILLTKKTNNAYYIIDGHHRFLLYKKLNLEYVKSIVTDLSFEEAEIIREVDRKLRVFDNDTDGRFGLSDFYKSFLAYKLNNYYPSHYKKIMFKNSFFYKFLRKIKKIFFGKEYIFKNFFERHNK